MFISLPSFVCLFARLSELSLCVCLLFVYQQQLVASIGKLVLASKLVLVTQKTEIEFHSYEASKCLLACLLPFGNGSENLGTSEI